MAASVFVAQPLFQGTITASGQTAPFALNQNFNSVLAMIETGTAPTGTTPTITFQLQVSLDGNWFNVGSATSSITTATLTQLSNSNVFAPLARIAYTVTGTTPSFTNVTINISMS